MAMTKDRGVLNGLVGPPTFPHLCLTMHYHPLKSSQYLWSPVNSLPVELLSYIFALSTHCTTEAPSPDDSQSQPAFTTESVKVPLILSTVSHHWRRVALNTPALWTSLCVSAEMLTTDIAGTSHLDTRHLSSYLALSRKYPLDIIIDARDPDWDFCEFGVTEYLGTSKSPNTLFSETHIQHVVSLLLPHLHRWRSLDILTDAWVPMYTALHQINPYIMKFGAPSLESLTLIRCNDFVSFAPDFKPAHCKTPAFLQSSILPRLRHLSLRGVHVEWSTLASELAKQSGPRLHHLDLSSHCETGSGPYLSDDCIPEQWHDSIVIDEALQPSIGYRLPYDGQAILKLVDAPNLKALAIEEVGYPSDPDDVDAGSLLSYVATSDFYLSSDYTLRHEPFKVKSHAKELESVVKVFKPAFPLLEQVSLNGVKACPQPLRSFFSSLKNVQQLELLQSLRIRGTDRLRESELAFITGELVHSRSTNGAGRLREVNIHVGEECQFPWEAIVDGNTGTDFNIFRELPLSDDDEEYCLDDHDQFEEGGAFNDPPLM
ncbi:hypothetical protein BD779DRAFT_1562663, partial [Infundibulicybe gibba]